MKINADRKALADDVAWVAQIVPRNPNMPALAGIRMRAEGEHLTMTAFDYEVTRRARVAVDVHDEGECLVSASFLSSIIGALTGREVALELDGRALTITCGRSVYRTQTLSIDDYPNLPSPPPPVGVVDAAVLAEAVAACHGPVDDEAPTEGFRGMRIEGSPQGLDIVGLDGRLLVHRALAWSGETFATTTPGKPLATAVGGLKGEVCIGANENSVSVADADRLIVLRTMSHQYAAWRKVPRPPDMDRFGVVVDRDELLAAVKRTNLLARSAKEAALITLSIDADTIEVTATDSEAGGSEVIDAEGDGAEVIPLNPQYLMQALTAMERGPVRLGIGHRRSPRMAGFTTVRPAHHDTPNEREATFAAREGGEAR